MNLKNLQSRLIMCLLAVVMSSVSLFAQVTTVKHVVVRGETLEDIAKSYNVTKEEIISLNPSAAQFVYVGMELTIPKKSLSEIQNGSDTSRSYNKDTDANTGGVRNDSVLDTLVSETSPSGSSDSSNDGNFIYWGIGYQASFDHADKGAYGIFMRGLSNDHIGFGMDFGAYANYGIVDKDFAGLTFLLGPAVGSRFGNVLASVALDASIASYGVVKEDGKKDQEIAWGITLFPQFAFDLGGDIKIVLGVTASWAKGADKLNFGFQAGLGF